MTAEYDHKGAYLSSEFGEKFARDYFGDEIIDRFSKFKKGKNEGQLKGFVEWSRCTKGGFGYNTGNDLGFGPLSGQKKHTLGGLEKKTGKIVLVELFGPVWEKDCHKYVNVCVARWYWEGLHKWSEIKALTSDDFNVVLIHNARAKEVPHAIETTDPNYVAYGRLHMTKTKLARMETLEGQEEDFKNQKILKKVK
tara:strand:- start:37 stop:621 length:585 start_codon:yes stop_codon:yes gene_type:complete